MQIVGFLMQWLILDRIPDIKGESMGVFLSSRLHSKCSCPVFDAYLYRVESLSKTLEVLKLSVVLLNTQKLLAPSPHDSKIVDRALQKKILVRIEGTGIDTIKIEPSRGFRTGLTQTGLYSYRSRLFSLKFWS